MDYSTTINDVEDPAGASPWGSSPASSPRTSRTGFGALTGDPPASPFRANPQTSNGPSLAGDDSQRPGTATTASETGESTILETEESQPDTDAPSTGAQPSAQATQQEAASQPRKPPQPQFKLQVKITGLERTGKKDPILRFDVHVRVNALAVVLQHTDYPRQTFHASVLHNIAMSDVFTQNS